MKTKKKMGIVLLIISVLLFVFLISAAVYYGDALDNYDSYWELCGIVLLVILITCDWIAIICLALWLII